MDIITPISIVLFLLVFSLGAYHLGLQHGEKSIRKQLKRTHVRLKNGALCKFDGWAHLGWDSTEEKSCPFINVSTSDGFSHKSWSAPAKDVQKWIYTLEEENE